MSEPTAPAVDLQYAPRPKLWRRRRFRLALLVLLGAAAVAGWWWRADVASSVATAKMLYAQRQCMTFEPPAGQEPFLAAFRISHAPQPWCESPFALAVAAPRAPPSFSR